MADYTLGVQITGDASKMQKAFEKAQEQAEKLKEKIKDSNNESGNSFDGLTTKIDAISGKLSAYGDKISSIGKNMTTMFTLPAVAGITAVVKEYANLEQSIGGVETLFKKSAKAVQKNANTAFRRAGVSANEYMEQVTSFSASLISSLGGDTAKAVGVADTAMVDMSDNANKFGTNIGLIQNAYQGFAKGNYTMLDNLRLGFGGTKEEMQRLLDEAGKLSGMEFDINNFSDIIQAIHIIQDNLGVTGTTAREASETISGSFSQAKASVIDFMGSLGGDGSDVDAKMQAMIQSITVFADNVKEALGRIWDNLPLQEYQKNLLLIAVVGGPILVVVGTIFGAIANIMTVVSGILTVLGMMTPIGWIIAAAIAAIVAAVVFWDDIVAEVGQKFELVKIIGMAMWESFKDGVSSFGKSIQNVVGKIGGWFAEAWNAAADTATRIFTKVGDTISGIFSGVVSGIKSLINGAIGGINKVSGITNKLPGVNIPKIPYLARGTSDWQGGFARINEGGRGELVHMPNGATVVPHDVSMKYARESAKANSGVAYMDSNDEIAKSALKLANDAVKRPVVLNINGREVAKTTGGDMRDYLNSRDMTLKRLRGEV
ncbi:TPA: phage tail protein [Streptococcus pyogenes]|nr:phage tail protein [Streptococcus pyogenes]HES4362994.1 phage tail protein [Streptococcus pyogenes]HES7336306.1 phage tail protein [Streptococcus pyogenes]HES7603871.1 phage tail protein [Streptococcus pyogenes]HES8268028.1 phage tail protein [Streptococcus pyogenes]